jgi:hypothetical protein
MLKSPKPSPLKPRPSNQQVVSVTAPVGGLNVRDPLSDMPPTDAYSIINWVPQQYGVRMRKGSADWGTGLGTAVSVKSVFSYFPNTSAFSASSDFRGTPSSVPGRLFGSTDANIYDVTCAGPGATVAQALSGASGAGQICTANFSNSAGQWLLACSEADGYFTYDGTTWTKVTLGGGATQVSVGDPTKFVQVALWMRRAWFVQKNSSKVWYLASDSIYGAATALDLGPLLKRGGAIAWIANWTVDSGDGVNDMLVFCSENGEILVYQGTDPAAAATFSLAGRWDVGNVPVGRRSFCQLGGDLLVLSSNGIAPLSYITKSGMEALTVSQRDYTSKIARELMSAVGETFNVFGWSLNICTREGLLIVTVPDTTSVEDRQYAMNLTSGAWTKLSGMNMLCSHVLGGYMFYGDAASAVKLAFVGASDDYPLVFLNKNRTFDYDIIWTKNASVTISGGKAVFDGVTVVAANTVLLSQPVTLVVGQTYTVSITISVDTTNPIAFKMGTSGITGTSRTAVGVYSETFVATSAAEVFSIIAATGPFLHTGSLDSVSIKLTNQVITSEPIEGTLQPAFNSFNAEGREKHFLLARLTFLASRTPAVSVAMNTDFNPSTGVSTPSLPSGSVEALWDVGIWDQSKWDGAAQPYTVWTNTPGEGYWGSLGVQTSSYGDLTLTDITYVFENGGPLG